MKKLLKITTLLFLTTACIMNGSGGKSTKSVSSSVTNGSDSKAPETVANYLQVNAGEPTNSLILDTQYNDSFYLRGTQIHNYLSGEINRTRSQCLVVNFNSNVVSKKILVLAAVPKFFNNAKTKSKEYYYFMQSLDTSVNKAYCQKTNLLNYIDLKYGNVGIAYSFKDVCTSCNAKVQSSPLKLLTPSGAEILDLAVTHLNIQLGFVVSGSNSTQLCSQKKDCVGQGYQCCINGQCVLDGKLKENVSSSTAGYDQALDDILSYPSHFKNYPQFFYVCPNEIPATPTADTTSNPYESASARFNEKKSLYNCTTIGVDEQTYCSVDYENASKYIIGTPTPLATKIDDRNFSNIYAGTYVYTNLTNFTGFSGAKIPYQSVVEISYGDFIIYSLEDLIWDPKITFTNSNDDIFAQAQQVKINNYVLPSSAKNDTLTIRYKTDGSCVPVNSSLIRCKKYYYQGQNIGRPSDHSPASQRFEVPSYADFSKAITVNVNDFALNENNEWSITTVNSKKYVTFVNSYTIYDKYKIDITYYVNTTLYPNVYDSKKAALERLDKLCNCGGQSCSLSPVYKNINSVETITDYICVYPTPIQAAPALDVTKFVSTKSAPLRYYDNVGGVVDEPTAESNSQDGNKFEYTQSNLLKPNNITTYVGFNEIYGSYSADAAMAKSPHMLKVKIGTVYHLFVNKAYFSSCLNCGTDYYSQLNKLFPATFEQGGGYIPDPVKASTTEATNIPFAEALRADDLLFGRACWIPATMIPWTTNANTDVRTQRNNRLKAQHLLFANGYQRDWYGFDYGSLIGSFDGVTWFSIGSNRTIKATTNKLFLAINSYFSDLTTDNIYSVTISEGAGGPYAGSSIDSDFKSDGAQCQKYHQCTTDADCVTQLGWEYSCQDVTGIKTYWPKFNSNADEIVQTNSATRIIDIIGGLGGGPNKRCVYRGRGAPCVPTVANTTLNYSVATSTDNNSSTTSYVYSQVDSPQPGLHSCLDNFYCQPFQVNNVLQAKFNRSIARFGKSPDAQNGSSDVDDSLNFHTFGLGARIIGRPFNFNGTSTVDSATVNQLASNYVRALCIPGRDVTKTTFLEQNSAVPPSTNYYGNQVTNIGQTLVDSNSGVANFFSACGIFDTSNNFIMNSNPNAVFSTEVNILAATQALSTNSLKKFEISSGSSEYKDIFSTFNANTEIVDKPTLQANGCFRAPGSVCHTDWDCGPTNFISTFVNKLSYDEVSETLNEAEYNFWKEGLVCSQKEFQFNANATLNDKYDLKLNRCCREVGKKFTIFSQYSETPAPASSPNYLASPIPGKDIALNNKLGYSRNSTNYYNIVKDATNGYVALKDANIDQCISGTCASNVAGSHQLSQFISLDYMAKNNSCSKSWIRNFHKDNGGGHKWGPAKMQSFDDISDFACLNMYFAKSGCGTDTVSCETQCDEDNKANCAFIGLDSTDQKRIGQFFSSLELTGIPQVLIKSTDFATPGPDRVSCDFTCQAHPTVDGIACTPAPGAPVPGTIIQGATAEFRNTSTNQKYLSAIDPNNFDPSIKFIFSASEFTSCMPTGEVYDARVTSDMCCTGTKNEETGYCCLPAFSNISVYLNRYVSSEANNLDKSLFDEYTGALKDISYAIQVAKNKNICCSGDYMTGAQILELKIPRATTNKDKSFRSIYDGSDSANEFKKGRHWNSDIYCVPAGTSTGSQPSTGTGSGSTNQ